MKQGTRGEGTEVDLRLIAGAGVALLAVVVVSFVVAWLVLVHLQRSEVGIGMAPNTLAGGTGKELPPEPRLQTRPLRDLQALRAEEEALLHSYGWVDREAGKVRIPIERAMELLADRRSGGARRGR